jgi:hypothetical protein
MRSAGAAVASLVPQLREQHGPTAGLTSSDSEVAQAGTESLMPALQLTGIGTTYEDVAWAVTSGSNRFAARMPGNPSAVSRLWK